MSQTTEELQNSVIEWQSYIIGELMRLYATGTDFHIPQELEEKIQQVRLMKAKLNVL